jgi:hypothetical protein
MPLSEHEQKILAQLEESLSKQDPRFAKSVRETNIYAHSLRQIRWSLLAFVTGLVILVAFFSQVILVGVVGVAIMFGAAVVIERNIRRIGKASLRDVARSRSGESLADGVAQRAAGFREWFFRQRPRGR